MGAKTWMIIYSNGNVKEVLNSNPKLDNEKTASYAKELFPDININPVESGDLSFTNPPDNQVFAGYFEGVFILAASEFGIDYPSRISKNFITKKYGNCIQLHAMHSVVDWFAFAVWENQTLKRSLSLSPDSGLLEDIGEKYAFELPFWEGKHPAIDPEDEDDEEYPFQFHPLDLAEEALKHMYGYQLEGFIDESLLEPEKIPLLTFERIKKPFWKLW